MARLTQEEMDALLARAGAGGRLVHSPVSSTQRIRNPNYDPDLADEDPQTYGEFLPGTMPVEQWVSTNGYVVRAIHMPDNSWEVIQDEAPDPSKNQGPQRTPDQQREDAARAAATERANVQAQREQDERDWNQFHPEQGGSGLPETHLERATREAKAAADAREAQRLRDEEARQAAATEAQKEQNRQEALNREERAREANQSTAISAASQAETVRHNQFLENEPESISADTKTPNIISRNRATGEITSVQNPNYDAVAAAAAERRAELASQIAARQISLDEAKQQYTQWFDTNVKTPIMMAQEQRAKAEEQRQALEAEERRRQFAADFGLRKASLGQQAAATAIQAEESLLPYRAGPLEAQHMSDAINGLAAGGIVGGPSAGAGVHFTGEDFQFNAPNFKKIAADATKAVLSGLTDYRPSDQQFATADYSGIPQVNLSGMPSYSYAPPAALPAPSPGAEAPTGG